MKKPPSPASSAADLRRRAEARLRAGPHTAAPSSVEDLQRLLHELRVHQIELELQNEEMIRARGELEASAERYADLYDFAPVSYLMLDPNGTIREANLTAATYFGVDRSRLIGRRFSLFLAEESLPTFREFLAAIGAADARSLCEVVLVNAGEAPRTARLEGLALAAHPGKAQQYRVVVVDVTRLKATAEALQVERQRLASILFAADVGTWEWNVQTGQTVFSERWAELAGYSLAELAPVSIDTWTRLVHPDDLKASGALLERHFRGELDHYECEARMRHKNGSWVWVLDRGRVTSWTKDGKPLWMQGTHYDITEHRQAAERSRLLRDLGFAAAAATLLPEALELCLQSTLSISGMDSAGIYLRDSQTGALDLQCHAGLSGSFLDSVRHMPADSPHTAQALKGTPLHGTMETLGLPGTPTQQGEGLKAVSLLPVLDEGELIAVLIVASHTLDSVPLAARHTMETVAGLLAGLIGRLRAQEALRRANLELEQRVADRTLELAQSEQRHRVLIETIPDWVWEVDAQTRYKFCGPQCRELLGFEPEDILGRTPFDLMPPEEARRVAPLIGPLMARGELLRSLEHVVRCKDGRLVTLETHAAPVLDAQGRIQGYRGVDHDISERKGAEEALRLAKEAAEAANRAKSVFLANMSHEIRTPMNAVLGFAQLLRRDPQATAHQQQQLATIIRSGEHLLELLNDILEMARIESGRLSLQPETFDVPKLVEELETLFGQRAQAKSLRFTVERPAGLPRYVTGDPMRLRQILINLLGNAVKFTPSGGAVTLRLGVQAAGTDIRLWAEVLDTGPGITAEDQAQLFRPFSQTGSGRQVSGGTGLGLAISRECARLMEGEITVQSQVGQGSCFRLEVPFVLGHAADVPAEPLSTRRVLHLRPGQAVCRVLVVDDQAENRELLEQALRPIGFETRSVASGAEALAQCRLWSPQVVVLDLRMPEMDGFAVALQLRAAYGEAMKILVLSATVFAEDQARARAAGADAFVGKPFRETDLLEQLRRLTGVEYVDQEGPAQGADDRRAQGRHELPSAQALGALPRGLTERLRTATLTADYDHLLELVRDVEAQDPTLGRQLQQLVERYEYTTLQAILSESAT